MTDSDPGLLLPGTAIEPVVDLATEAERLGYGSVWAGELWGSNAFVRLTEVAAATNEIDVGTAIVNVYSRTPAVIAMGAASLDRVAGGDVSIGLGPSTPRAIESIHGKSFDRPVRRIHETAEAIDRLTGGGDDLVEYDGETASVKGCPPLDAEVSVYNAALGPANRRATGRVCDGWIPHNIPFAELEEAFETIATAAREAGRDPDAIDVTPYVPAAVCETTAEAHDHLRGHIAYYVGSGEGYERAVAMQFPERAGEVATAWRDGDREEAIDLVTDEMVAALGVAGTPDEARDQLREIAALDIVDRPLITVPNRMDREGYKRTMRELAPGK